MLALELRGTTKSSSRLIATDLYVRHRPDTRCAAYIRAAAYYDRFSACWWPCALIHEGCVAKADDGGCGGRPAASAPRISLLMGGGGVVLLRDLLLPARLRSRSTSRGRLAVVTSRNRPVFRFARHGRSYRTGRSTGATALPRLRGSTRASECGRRATCEDPAAP
jgi:hypothetical protein